MTGEEKRPEEGSEEVKKWISERAVESSELKRGEGEAEEAQKKGRKTGFREETKKAGNHEGGFPKQSSRRTLRVWRALLLSADVVRTEAAFAPQVWKQSRRGGGGGGAAPLCVGYSSIIFSKYQKVIPLYVL